jgi:hypothetical protein
MKRIISLFVCILLGIGIGWYFGYTRPVARDYRELLKEYQRVRDTMGLTDQQMAEFGPKARQYFEDMKRQDEKAAMFGLVSFQMLERGNIEEAKKRLLFPVRSYYRIYHNKGGDTNFMGQIEEAARKYPAIAARISAND